jgi:hypothetical protein
VEFPVDELIDYLERERSEWEKQNADRFHQTTRILGFVHGAMAIQQDAIQRASPEERHGLYEQKYKDKDEAVERYIEEQFQEFGKAYKYNMQKDDGEYVYPSTNLAFIAFRNGFRACWEETGG